MTRPRNTDPTKSRFGSTRRRADNTAPALDSPTSMQESAVNKSRFPAIAVTGVSIRQDAEGRYCLNDLHRAAVSDGANERTKEPAKFLSSPQIGELVAEMTDTQNPGIGPVNAVKGGLQQGTYVAKELVYAYAMWISPAFHLKVIRAYDAMVSAKPQHLIPQTLPEALRLAADLAEQNAQAKARLAVVEPKAEALDRIATADGLLCITDAAKTLQVRPKDLFSFLDQNKWTYRRVGSAERVAYSDRLLTGLLAHKTTTIHRDDGSEKVITQVRITGKGLAKIAMALGVEVQETLFS